MGVDAAVYKRLEEVPLPAGSDLNRIIVDDITGETYFDDASPVKLPRENAIAVERRLGNMHHIQLLYDQLSRLIPGRRESSLLLNAVLYSGTHAGDVIPLSDAHRLKEEIASVRSMKSAMSLPEVARFLLDMEELVVASERTGNPIVFI
jgi:hypothetical protein